MANLPLAFAELLAGGILIVAGATGDSIGDVFQGKIVTQPLPGAGGGGSGGTAGAGAISPAASATGKGGYVNPFAQATGLVKERIDMGWDFHTSGAGQPILSIGDAKITNIVNGWFNGQPLIETQLLSGPQAGKFIYYAEGLTPTVKVGDIVAAGQRLATTTSQPSGLEFGFGADAAGTTLAKATTGYHEGDVTPAGRAFHDFLAPLLG